LLHDLHEFDGFLPQIGESLHLFVFLEKALIGAQLGFNLAVFGQACVFRQAQDQ
jgi:hypothetical protein